jgi:hypothetical protein
MSRPLAASVSSIATSHDSARFHFKTLGRAEAPAACDSLLCAAGLPGVSSGGWGGSSPPVDELTPPPRGAAGGAPHRVVPSSRVEHTMGLRLRRHVRPRRRQWRSMTTRPLGRAEAPPAADRLILSTTSARLTWPEHSPPTPDRAPSAAPAVSGSKSNSIASVAAPTGHWRPLEAHTAGGNSLATGGMAQE